MTLEVETGRSCYPFAPESQRVRISAQIYLGHLEKYSLEAGRSAIEVAAVSD